MIDFQRGHSNGCNAMTTKWGVLSGSVVSLCVTFFLIRQSRKIHSVAGLTVSDPSCLSVQRSQRDARAQVQGVVHHRE